MYTKEARVVEGSLLHEQFQITLNREALPAPDPRPVQILRHLLRIYIQIILGKKNDCFVYHVTVFKLAQRSCVDQ